MTWWEDAAREEAKRDLPAPEDQPDRDELPQPWDRSPDVAVESAPDPWMEAARRDDPAIRWRA